MYAVIETGGKQYRVEVGTELQVELLDAEPGKTVTIDRVLLVADGDEASIGRPLVGGAEVSAEVLRQIRGDKVIAFKYRPKARRRVKKGHRQDLTVLRINDIVVGGKSAAKAAARADQDAKSERQRLEEAAAVQAAKDAELAAKLATRTTTASKPATKKAAPKVKAAPADETMDDAAKPATKKAAPRGKTTTAPKASAEADTDAPATPADSGAPARATKSGTTRSTAPKRTTKKDE
jgi:large subunit ribosomal protein L21